MTVRTMMMKARENFVYGFVGVLAAAALLLVGGFVAPGVAVAQGASGSKAALIVDASGSMLDADVDGGTRMDAAKKAAHELVNDLPDSANLGLLAYGMRVSNAPEDHARGCQDVETLVPVGKLDRDLLNSKIDEMTPSGYTPIGNSLRAAAKELGDDGERTIILVSDGIDTCAPPPVCEVAKELAGEGVDLTIHTVGFKTDEEARKELECVARVSGGDFMEADDSASLAESLKFLAQRDAETYQTAGTWFEYADTPEDAKWLGEGRYRTKVNVPKREHSGGHGADHFFKLAIPEGHRAIVSTAIIPQRAASGRAREANLHVLGGNLLNPVENCRAALASDLGAGSTYGSGFLPPEPAVRVIDPEKSREDCDPQEWIVPTEFSLLSAARDEGTSGAEADVELEINFEPILDDSEKAKYPEPGEKTVDEDSPSLDFNDVTPVKGGPSFAQATEVKPGAYSDALVPGEYRFYKIPVEYGQQPVVNVRTGISEREAAETLNINLYSPLRIDHGSDSLIFYDEAEEGAVVGDKVDFRNSYKDSNARESGYAGYYLVGVALSQGDEDDIMGVEQPFEIAFDVVGKKVDGPKWRPTEKNGPEPSDTPPGTDKKKSDKSDDSDVQAQDESGDGGFGLKNMVMVAVGAGIVVLLAALVALIAVLRRK
ncbi:vWA domain-containing protein [Corynebacterium tuscaniense]|uniref:vWA domain-containing protein n=1 Tax=Corynebacterium tuscaniense TaxID=302449 RepID=UPI0018DCDEDE|nr:VWA domain-containing protein [Corynebacterium tuscaniense]